MSRLAPFIVVTAFCASAQPPLSGAGTPQTASAKTQRTLHVTDGDTIVLEGAGSIRVVRRREGVARIVFNPAQRWLIVLFDDAARPGAGRGASATFTLHDLDGNWPLGERWEGPVLLEEYQGIGDAPTYLGLGVRTAHDFIQLTGVADSRRFRDPDATTLVTFRGFSRGFGGGVSFDEAERRQAANASASAERRAQLPGGPPNSYFGLSAGIVPGSTPGAVQRSPSGTQAPVRVGGSVAPPRKITHVPPVYPERARTLGIGGTVILEVTIGTDGRVSDARVLRSIELLDDAALEAVRQWRYEPVRLNGAPVPVVLTVTVNFP